MKNIEKLTEEIRELRKEVRELRDAAQWPRIHYVPQPYYVPFFQQPYYVQPWQYGTVTVTPCITSTTIGNNTGHYNTSTTTTLPPNAQISLT